MSAFAVGDQVNVESRTWPGINKPGGVGRIVKVHSEAGNVIVAVDVKYILGGTEKEVELQYVKKHEELNRGGRSRSRREVMNLGREDKKKTTENTAAAENKPKRASASKPKAAKAKAPPAAAAAAKRKTATTSSTKKKKRKVDTIPTKKSSKNKSTSAPSSPIVPSDSDSVVVSADESELTAPSYKPVATKKKTKAVKKKPLPAASSKLSTTATNAAKKQSHVVPQDKPPRAPTRPTASAAAKPAAKPAPKLKKFDKNKKGASTATSTSMSQTTLQKVHESNSRAASSFVGDIVGGREAAASTTTAAAAAAAAASSSDDTSTVLVHGGDDQSTTAGNTHSTSASLTVDTQRRQLFVSNLNEVMMKRMVEEMTIGEILTKVNAAMEDDKKQPASAPKEGLFEVDNKKNASSDPSRPFTNLEIRSYLNELDRQQKIMVTWDTGTVYRI